MSLVVDIAIIALLALGAYKGWRAGVLKSLVKFVGLVAIVILSFTFKDYLANFLMDIVPFYNYGGLFDEIYSINIFVFNGLSFLVIFILLYCLLSIVISITGFIDTLLKFTVIWVIPSKVAGAIVGVLENWVFVLVILSVFAQLTFSAPAVYSSNLAPIIMEKTPIVGKLMKSTSESMKKIYTTLEEAKDDKEMTREALDIKVLQQAIGSGLITTEKATELMEIGKLPFENVLFG